MANYDDAASYERNGAGFGPLVLAESYRDFGLA